MGRINAFRVIERLEKLNILGGQNTESVKPLLVIVVVVVVLDSLTSNYFSCSDVFRKRRTRT